MIVGYVWRILGRGAKKPPHPWAAPKKPILNRVKHSQDDFTTKQLTQLTQIY